MATSTADNYNQQAFNNPYGNLSVKIATKAAFPTLANADTFDLMKIPAGAYIVGAHLVVATAIATSTVHIGVRYADGTSTGGTTGTAVLSGTGVLMTTANAKQYMNFVPFRNDADTIVYLTQASPGQTPGANNAFAAVVEYEASGTK